MAFWEFFWTLFFFGSLALFTGLSVVVSIVGFFNIRSLFKNMADQNNQKN